jgi:DNA-binding winged helix-turn-helix (wHTH) protein
MSDYLDGKIDEVMKHDPLSTREDMPMSSRPALSTFDRGQSVRLEPEFEGCRDLRSADMDEPLFRRRANPADQALNEIAFGPFRLLPAQFLLLEGDKPVSIGSRALEILIALLERQGELVTKQELMARVWPSIFVEPANLTVHISALRRALRDGRDGNRFIINIPGRGYRFVASIQSVDAQEASTSGLRSRQILRRAV